jgi:integrase
LAFLSCVFVLLLINGRFAMTLNINLTRRVRRRKLKDGSTVEQTRYALNWRDPRTGEREQRFFERQREAQERRSEFLAAYERGVYSSSPSSVTVETAVAAWLETKRGVVWPITFATYQFQSRYVVGPLVPSEARRAIILSGVGAKPKARAIELLGREKVQELTTRRIRAWHKLLSDEVSIYCANKAMQILKAALALAAEDHEFRPPAMPAGLQRQRDKARKMVLTPDEVARLLNAARHDIDKGVYVAFPFLAGTRPSEQLGLLWDDIDFEANVIRVRRIQMRDGSLSEFTKTAAGVRSIPMSPLLREMLLAWRVRSPRKDVKLERVFPAPGVARAWPLPRLGEGGAFIYGNFRRRYWGPTLKRLGLPAVTPHSARHSFISVLQAQGVEVGLVAKLAGHKNAVVTLSHYTHAMRGGEDAVKALDRAYAASAP